MGVSYSEKEAIYYFIFIAVGMLLDYIEGISSNLSRITTTNATSLPYKGNGDSE